MNPASNPEPVEDLHGDDRWMSQHKRFVQETKEKEPDVLFIGDQLIQELTMSKVWKRMLEPLHSLNFGISADQTQNVLWRVMNGELDSFQPKVIVLLVGTNNLDHTVEQVVGGILEIVTQIQARQPQADLVVMGIPPRGEKPNPLREKIQSINKSLTENLKCVPKSTFLSVEPSLFVNKKGDISHMDMYDYLRFTEAGYEKLCDPLIDCVQDLLKDFIKVENISIEDSDSLAGDLATKVP